jgi:glycerophosphoryl diester phosphodiesterase
VLKQVRRHPRAAVLVSSFDHGLLMLLRRTAPRLPLAFLCREADWPAAIERAAACRAESFHPRYDILSPGLASACHRRGLAVYPWVVDARADIDRCRALAVDGVFCNDPGQVAGWLHDRK